MIFGLLAEMDEFRKKKKTVDEMRIRYVTGVAYNVYAMFLIRLTIYGNSHHLLFTWLTLFAYAAGSDTHTR